MVLAMFNIFDIDTNYSYEKDYDTDGNELREMSYVCIET